MNELNINDLPPEILVKVFRFLDVVNLENATLTCKLWNNVIESSCRWSLRLSYEEHKGLCAKQRMEFIRTTNRKFGKIAVRSIDSRPSDKEKHLYKIFKRHGSDVVELFFCFCRFKNLDSIAQLLNLTPNLARARIMYCASSSDMLLDQDLPNLKKLKNLTIAGDGRIIKCFRKAKITTMEIRHVEHERHSVLEECISCNSLVDFLLSQNMLTSLTFDAKSSSILIETGRLKVPIPFRLTYLESRMEDDALSHDHDNFLRFVKTQAESLTEFRIGYEIPNSVYECAFANMAKLHCLTVIVSAYGIPKDRNFYEQLKKNCSIRTIRLLDYISDGRFVADFLEKLPNTRHLILPYSKNENILATAQNLKQLESLSIDSFHQNSIKNLIFPNLKTLHIRDLSDKIDWNEFTRIHSLLVELTIETMDHKSYLTSNDIDKITTNVDLQHIRLGVGFVADDRFFEIVRSKCTNLKTLDLDGSCISHEPEDDVKINVLRLYDFKSCDAFRTVWSE